MANGGTSSPEVKRSLSTRSTQPHYGCCGSNKHHAVAKRFRLLRDHKWFQTSIILVILVAGVQVGIATYNVPSGSALANVLEIMDEIVMVIFIVEIVIKMIAEGNKPWLFFNDAWNCFDFAIVAVGLMPVGNAVTALRLIRLLRVLKLVRALPKLRLLVMGLLRSMSSIAYIGLLLGMLFYLYAVVGVSMFGTNDPVHMGNLHITLLSLFRIATLEDWSDIMYIATTGCENWGYDGMESKCVNSIKSPVTGLLYFCTFVVLANMMILNLFIGVITTSMAEAKEVLEAEMEAEMEEKEIARRALLGLSSDSEEDDDIDLQIVNSLSRVEYLLAKCDTKANRFKAFFTKTPFQVGAIAQQHNDIHRASSAPFMPGTNSNGKHDHHHVSHLPMDSPVARSSSMRGLNTHIANSPPELASEDSVRELDLADLGGSDVLFLPHGAHSVETSLTSDQDRKASAYAPSPGTTSSEDAAVVNPPQTGQRQRTWVDFAATSSQL